MSAPGPRRSPRASRRARLLPARRGTALLLALLAPASLVAACGDDDAPDAAGTTTTAEAADEAGAPPTSAGDDATGASCTRGPVTEPSTAGDGALRHATNLAITDADGYRVVTVAEPSPGADAESYVLVDRGAGAPDLPADLEGAPVIEVPVESIALSSTTDVASLVELGVVDTLVGFSDLTYVTAAAARARGDEPGFVQFATSGTVDVEQVLAADPEVLLTGGFDDPGYAPLRDAGVTVVASGSFLESSPLGRAEWIRLFGALYGLDDVAVERFAAVEAAYLDLVAATSALPGDALPLVTTGSVFAGTYFASGGRSYNARLLADAGACYVWADDTSTLVQELDLEAQLERAGDADLWIGGSVFWDSLAAMVEEDARYGEFRPVQEGTVWLEDLADNGQGGLDFYERGAAHPELVLADLVAIVHPELAPDHVFTFYRRLPPS